MSVERNGEIHLDHLVAEVLNPWYKYGWLEFSMIESHTTSLSLLYNHLASIFQKNDLATTEGNTVTLEGSMAEVASGLADPNLLSRLRHDLLKSNSESINTNPAVKDFLPEPFSII